MTEDGGWRRLSAVQRRTAYVWECCLRTHLWRLTLPCLTLISAVLDSLAADRTSWCVSWHNRGEPYSSHREQATTVRERPDHQHVHFYSSLWLVWDGCAADSGSSIKLFSDKHTSLWAEIRRVDGAVHQFVDVSIIWLCVYVGGCLGVWVDRNYWELGTIVVLNTVS